MADPSADSLLPKVFAAAWRTPALVEHLPIVVLFAIALAFVGLSLLVSHRLGPNQPNPTKVAAYESGIVADPGADVRGSRFAVKWAAHVVAPVGQGGGGAAAWPFVGVSGVGAPRADRPEATPTAAGGLSAVGAV